jgi:flagellar basal-body rod modification protein FlgD
MAAVSDSTAGNSVDILAALNKKNTTANGESSKPALGQDAFLKLLITQLKNQSPLDPQDNTAFVAQLAQFSSLQGIQNLNSTVTSLSSGLQSSQALQASALVGRTVEVETSKAGLSSGGIVRGTMVLENSTPTLKLNVYNASNQVVLQKDLGSQEAGEIPFAWDGKAADGTALPSGVYRFEVLASENNKSVPVTTYLGNNVNSVTVGSNQEATLNVDVVGPVALGKIKNIL